MQIKTITLSLDALANLISLPEGVIIASVKGDSQRSFEIIVADADDHLKANAVFDLPSRKWVVPQEISAAAPEVSER